MVDKASGLQSKKRLGVDKTNARIIALTSISAFLVVFFLVASWSLFGQLTYQNRIIGAKKQAVGQLKKNIDATGSLVESYKSFVSQSTNFIGGSASGTGPQDGNNARIVLDALPATYDFPALTTSLEKLANDQKVTIESITGTDDAVAQNNNASASPTPVEIPFEMKVSGTYAADKLLVDAFDHSIRPIQIQKMTITGDQQVLNLDVTAKTFYQPAKPFNIQMKVIK